MTFQVTYIDTAFVPDLIFHQTTLNMPHRSNFVHRAVGSEMYEKTTAVVPAKYLC